jgi:hypothetical protein
MMELADCWHVFTSIDLAWWLQVSHRVSPGATQQEQFTFWNRGLRRKACDDIMRRLKEIK